MAPHASDSGIQNAAEGWVLDGVAERLGVTLLRSHRVKLGASTVVVDGATADESILVEVFAHHGKLKGGQAHKVSTDVLKLITVAKHRNPRPRLILTFADPEATSSLSGRSWLAESLRTWRIEVLVAELTQQQHAAIRAAQARQAMTNSPGLMTPDDPD